MKLKEFQEEYRKKCGNVAGVSNIGDCCDVLAGLEKCSFYKCPKIKRFIKKKKIKKDED